MNSQIQGRLVILSLEAHLRKDYHDANGTDDRTVIPFW